MDATCTIEDCEGRVVGRGYCRKHYTRWHRYGDPLSALQRRPQTVDEDEWFWAHVDKSAGPDACWPWTGGKNKAGYGICRHSADSRLAHRVAFFLTYGYMPDDSADHQCHNADPDCKGGVTDPHRACCNPGHAVDRPRPDNAAMGKLSRRFCKQGHEFPISDQRWGNYRCYECYRLKQKRQLVKQHQKRGAIGPGRGRKQTEACAQGHPWVDGSYYLSQGHRKCKICHLSGSAKRQAELHAAAQLARDAGLI